MTPMTPLLEAHGVGKRFGAVVAAADISISIAAGERVSLIGSNGAGKTTFVNMITGYLKPDEGRIVLDGRDITPLHPRAITRLGVARSFQIPQLYGDLTVLDNMLVANACHDQALSFWQPARTWEPRSFSSCSASSSPCWCRWTRSCRCSSSSCCGPSHRLPARAARRR